MAPAVLLHLATSLLCVLLAVGRLAIAGAIPRRSAPSLPDPATISIPPEKALRIWTRLTLSSLLPFARSPTVESLVAEEGIIMPAVRAKSEPAAPAIEKEADVNKDKAGVNKEEGLSPSVEPPSGIPPSGTPPPERPSRTTALQKWVSEVDRWNYMDSPYGRGTSGAAKESGSAGLPRVTLLGPAGVAPMAAVVETSARAVKRGDGALGDGTSASALQTAVKAGPPAAGQEAPARAEWASEAAEAVRRKLKFGAKVKGGGGRGRRGRGRERGEGKVEFRIGRSQERQKRAPADWWGGRVWEFFSGVERRD